ncbi:hypothetical protein DXT99_08235 [Pontibacter diazotrophicus]|uniref:Uncharacterized protein n=1 Tax=Pontibacter diazotrophicus TaxID=1400979 RepID=A0A3D8LDW9_9BACT|nr:hypothetical protein [Pontibacter diazotrophicus]RDV15474.1 hypothetical protein DXT99_08235 [Pontibacter diazotrophicus]
MLNETVNFTSPIKAHGGMSELADFTDKLNYCDLIVLTWVSRDRIYCRFFLSGIYMDRMYVSDEGILSHLHRLCGVGDEISTSGVAELKQLFVRV